MRYPPRRNILSLLGRLLRRILARRRPAPAPVPVRAGRRGLTIVEMLVTLAITLVMMGAVVNLFANIGQSVNDSRAAIEMSSMLRSARQLLQQDLAGATCPTLPWTRLEAGVGYFEIIEGPRTDESATTQNLVDAVSLIPRAALASTPDVAPTLQPLNGLGDFDDILALTVRSDGAPFVGRFGDGTIESNLAEVIWFAVENPAVPPGDPLYRGEPGMRTVYRRVLLITPSAALPKANDVELEPDKNNPILNTFPAERRRAFFRNYDVSARLEGDQWVANSLSDLTKRECRFAHWYEPANANNNFGFPHPMILANIRGNPRVSDSPLHPFGGEFEFSPSGPVYPPPPGDTLDRSGEDVVLTDVLAFDIRVYDPLAPLVGPSPPVLKPGDPKWDPGSPVAGLGAYVDLGFLVSDKMPSNNLTRFSSEMAQKSKIPNDTPPKFSPIPLDPLVHAVYDTWSFHYEVDGLDQDGDGLIDEGTDGIDNPPGQFGVDDIAERETSPPYPVPLRAVEVRLRTYERDSRQVREVSVHQSFVPQ